MNRVRYQKSEVPGVWKSVRTFDHPTNGSKFQVTINENNLSFQVHDLATGEPFHLVIEGSGSNFHKVKILAKEAVAKLGVEMGEKESRQRKQEEVNQ